jgi:hypothetical protein
MVRARSLSRLKCAELRDDPAIFVCSFILKKSFRRPRVFSSGARNLARTRTDHFVEIFLQQYALTTNQT